MCLAEVLLACEAERNFIVKTLDKMAKQNMKKVRRCVCGGGCVCVGGGGWVGGCMGVGVGGWVGACVRGCVRARACACVRAHVCVCVLCHFSD